MLFLQKATSTGFIQILHHCSASCEITLLYFSSRSFIWFGQKEPIKAQNFRISTTHVKFHQICTCDKLLLLKVYKISAKKVERYYVSWHWRMMQILKRNWLVVLKLTWVIWQILTQALNSLKNLHFNRLLLTKVYNVWAKKKSTEELFFLTLKSNKKVWKKIDMRFGKWHEEFRKFSREHSKVSKLGLWWDPLIPSRKCVSLKFTEELCAW